jgi:O-acetyl-ADP-ribose deacetylase (regulator of RNase III)
VAFPAIGTGIYGFPLQPATEIAVATVREVLETGSSVEHVIFACFSADVLRAYRNAGLSG